MAPPDYPRLPHSYRVASAEIRSVSRSINSRNSPRPTTSSSSRDRLRAAAALAIAAHAGEDRYAFAVEQGQVVEGELDRDGTQANLDLLDRVASARNAGADEHMRLKVVAGQDPGREQSTPLHLALDEGQNLSLNFDSSLLSDLEAEWFLSHVATAYASLDSSNDSLPLSSIQLAPSSESSHLAELSQAPPPPQVYPEDCATLPAFFLQAAELYPDDPALHFVPSPESPTSEDLVLSFSQLRHLAEHLAQSLLSSVTPQVASSASDYVVPLCIDKSPEMIISMVAITLAGFGYLALEPSWPGGRKETILNELRTEGKLAGVAVVQAKDGENDKWTSWSVGNGEDESRLVNEVITPSSVFGDLKSSGLETLKTEYPVRQREWKTPRPDGIAYVIYTSGTTGVPKGIEVQHRNVAAFLRNYRDVFGRARGERVLQFPSYSFDVSVMNIWDTFAHGATVCVTTPASLFSDLAGSILRLDCTLVDLTPTISSLLFEHLEAQPREGESERDAWERAGFRIKQVNTGGEKVEKAVRERWRERGVRVVIDYGPTETTVGVVSNQSLDPTPANGLPIGRPTGLTRIHILSTSTLAPVPLGCIGEICVTGEQVTQGYVRKQLNEGVFFDLDDDQARLLGIESQKQEERRLYRTGDLGRWLADGQGNIECLGRKDGQVKVNGLRIEIGEIEEHLSAKTNLAIVRGIVDKFETENVAPSLVAFLEVSPSFLAQQNAPAEDSSTLVHPFTSSPEFAALTTDLSKALGEKVPHYMVPRYWLAVSRIPTAGMGKADRKTLRGLAEKHDFRRRKSASRDGEEKKQKVRTDDKYHDAARKAWARVLKLDEAEIGDDDGFTELGGDSIRFMRIVSVLRSAGWRVGFRQLGEARKLGECAAVLEHLESSSTSGKLGEDSQDQAYRPFSLIARDAVAPLLDEIANSPDYSLPRASISDVYPTSPSQDALLAPSFDSPVGHYYAQAIYPVKTDIETPKLEQAIERLIQRHEVLRTVFVLPETLGTTAQVVLANEDAQVKRAAKVERVKVGAGPWDETVSEWLRSDRKSYPFKWGQLHVSFALFDDDAGARKLGWSLHHAMSDGWTLELLTADLRALCYDLELPNRPPFSSFVSWWASEKEPPASTADFWRSQLSGAQPLHWPSQDPLNGEMLATTAAAVLHWTGDLSGLSQRNGITPAIASRLATSLALAHHAGSNDVTLGIVRSGRDIDVDLADTMIGPCVSVLPSRLVLDPTASPPDSPSLLDLAKAETKADRLARLHQRVTLSDLARVCALPGRADLFDILVTFQSLAELDDADEDRAPWPIRQPPERIHMPTNYTLSFEFTPEKHEPDRLELACYFDARIITQREVDGVLATVAQVLDYLTTAPCTKANQLRLGETAPKIDKKEKKPTERGGISNDERSRLGPLILRLKREWSAVLRLDEGEVRDDESFGALGGDSISTMRLAVRLSKAGIAIPTQSLAKLPTLVEQARWLSEKGKTA